jgi:ArsR family transcriptional regulator, arsenate/arsenite/antimonite-responsive transcriptional repressor
MKTDTAIEALSALAHATRLKVFRLLVRKGPHGLPAGEIASRLGVHAATMSHHLGLLERAGLLRSWRVARQVFYAADFKGMRGLIGYLAEDCCAGLPEFAPAMGERKSEMKEEIEA